MSVSDCLANESNGFSGSGTHAGWGSDFYPLNGYDETPWLGLVGKDQGRVRAPARLQIKSVRATNLSILYTPQADSPWKYSLDYV